MENLIDNLAYQATNEESMTEVAIKLDEYHQYRALFYKEQKLSTINGVLGKSKEFMDKLMEW